MSDDESLPDAPDHESHGEVPLNDIELAYRQALDALNEAERQVGSAFVDLVDDQQSSAADDESAAPGLSIGEQLAQDLDSVPVTAESEGVLVEGHRRVSPAQVIEAAIFVGGEVPLTARKLASLIGQDVDSRVAVSLVDQLNQTYARENRPYEIRLHEGGYRLDLREEFREIQMRAYGFGPREVRLSPDVLEILAYIAYNQPLTKDDFGRIDRPNAMNVVRQLLRLQLVELQRTGSKRADVSYVTSARFLKLFGLRSPSDLPTADVFSFK